MSFYELRLEGSLEDSLNYISSKEKMEVVLEDNELKEFIDKDIPKRNDSHDLMEWIKCVVKLRRIILKGVQDHVFLNLHSKETPFSMLKALTYLFQYNNDHRKLALKEKLINIKMEKGGTIPKYLTKFTQCQDCRNSL